MRRIEDIILPIFEWHEKEYTTFNKILVLKKIHLIRDLGALKVYCFNVSKN